MNKTKETILKDFEEKFSNPDKFSSSNQFNPNLAGKLYQEFQSFLSSALDKVADEARHEAVGDVVELRNEVRQETLEEVEERLELDNVKIWDGHLHIAAITKAKIDSLKSGGKE